MKKLLLILLALVALAPSLVLAQEENFGDAVVDDQNGTAQSCENFNCHCTMPYPSPYIGVYQTGVAGMPPDITTATTPDECQTACVGVWGPENAEQEAAITATLTCKEGVTPIAPRTEVNEPILPNLNVKIPGLCDMSDGGECWAGIELFTTPDGVQHSNLLGSYIKALYGYLLGAGTLIAVTMLMIAGIQYATARGDAKQVDNAKKRIGNAVAGVILLLLAYNIAFLINPATTTFESLSLEGVKAIEIDDETPPGFVEAYTSTTEESSISVPLYNQKDYADYAYGPAKCNTGTSGNIKSSGCGVVSFSMVVAALTGTTVNPPEVAQSFYEDGYRPMNSQGCGHSGTFNSAMYESRLLTSANLKARQIPISDKAELRELVSQDKLIITSYRTESGGGHYVVISGYTSDGKLIVSNPWGGTREARSETWWFSNIKSAAYIDTEADFIE